MTIPVPTPDEAATMAVAPQQVRGNRILRFTRYSALISVLAFVIAMLVAAASTPLRGYTAIVYVLMLISFIGTAAGLTAVITGIIGVSRARALGGLGGGLVMLIFSIPVALLNLGALALFAAISTAVGAPLQS